MVGVSLFHIYVAVYDVSIVNMLSHTVDYKLLAVHDQCLYVGMCVCVCVLFVNVHVCMCMHMCVWIVCEMCVYMCSYNIMCVCVCVMSMARHKIRVPQTNNLLIYDTDKFFKKNL